jgi:hypothetical protein
LAPVEVVEAFTEEADERMAKDRIDRNELADKPVEKAAGAEDPLRAMAEMVADFLEMSPFGQPCERWVLFCGCR